MANMHDMISLRVWGDYACVTRPELKSERVSYPLLTPSAARGVLEAIYYEPQITYIIDSIGVIKKGRWFSFRRNELAKTVTLRSAQRWMEAPEEFKPIQAGGGAEDATQRGMLALADVEYVITARIQLTKRAEPQRDNPTKYREMFASRASRGKCSHRPYLGCREFDAYFDWADDPEGIALCDWPNEDLGLMLYDVFDPRKRDGGFPIRPCPVFFRNAQIRDARLDCHPDRVELIRRSAGE